MTKALLKKAKFHQVESTPTHEKKTEEELTLPLDAVNVVVKVDSVSGYRKRALEHYKRHIGGVHVNVCVICGFGVPEILEIAHLDQDRKNNTIENLAPLCPNCHKMHDLHLIPTEVVVAMRDLKVTADWKPRMKDAGKKAGLTRRKNSLAAKRSAAGKAAYAKRVENKKVKGDAPK